MRFRHAALLCALVATVAGCGEDADPVARPTATVTVTATATATVTAAPPGIPAPSMGGGVEPTDPAPRPLTLTVFEDGCGVIRSETAPGAYENLTWTFRDADGFQVLGRNAQGETRYRYFRGGTYEVVLEAWGGDHYVPVSNAVTVHC